MKTSAPAAWLLALGLAVAGVGCGRKDATVTPSAANPSSPPGAATRPEDAQPVAPYVRAGPLSRAMRFVDLVEVAPSSRADLNATLRTGEQWTLTNPWEDVALEGLPSVQRTPWIHLRLNEGDALVPFAAIDSVTLTPVSGDRERARAMVRLTDGSELRGIVHGNLGGQCEYGQCEIAWSALGSLQVTRREVTSPAPLPLGKGLAQLADGREIPFESWAVTIGDVVSDHVLVEAGTGPELLALAESAKFQLSGPYEGYFYRHGLAMDGGPVRPVALTRLMFQQANGCVWSLEPDYVPLVTRR